MSQIKGALEENILTLLCWSDDHSPMLSTRVESKHFSTPSWQKIVDVAIKYVAEYKCAPKLHLRDILEKELREDSDELLKFAIDNMENIYQSMNSKYVMDQFEHFLETKAIDHAIIEATKAVRKNDLTAAYAALSEPRPKQRVQQGIWLSEPDQALRFMDNETDADYFPSGVPELDRVGVRPSRKTLTVLLAETNKGKTWWAVQLGKHSLMHRKSVLHITLEMSEEKIAQRYIQCLFGMSQNKSERVTTALFKKDDHGYYVTPTPNNPSVEIDSIVSEPTTKENRALIVDKLRILQNRRIHIREYPPGFLTVPELRRYILNLGRTDDFYPDLTIVDYGDRMNINSKNYRTDIGANFVGLRSLGVEFNMAVASPTQTNRGGVGAKWVTRKHTGEDFSKVQTADTILTYSQTDREERIGMARLLVDKARDAKKGYRVWISQAYEIGQFCVDSVLMDEKAAKELKRMAGEDE